MQLNLKEVASNLKQLDEESAQLFERLGNLRTELQQETVEFEEKKQAHTQYIQYIQRVFVFMCIYLLSYIHTLIILNTYTYIHTYIQLLTYIYAYIHTYIHTVIHTYILSYLYVYIHTYILSYLNAYIHTYILTYIHKYCHTVMHTYITYIHSRRSWMSCFCASPR